MQTFWNHILKYLQLNQPFLLSNLNSMLFSILENSRDEIFKTQCQKGIPEDNHLSFTDENRLCPNLFSDMWVCPAVRCPVLEP